MRQKKEELEVGELVRRVLVQEEEGGSREGVRGREECVGGVEVKYEEGREWDSQNGLKSQTKNRDGYVTVSIIMLL